MAQETTTTKRCETCGRLGACPSFLRGKLTDMRHMKMEDTPGFCGKWVSKDYAHDAGIAVDDTSVPDQLQGQQEVSPIPAGTDALPPHQVGGLSKVEPLPAAGVRPAVDFKALDKLIDYGKAKELGKIEARIDTAKRQTMGALLEIGRCLNEAKDKGLVPHGQFEEWAAEQTGMGERTRQRIMQAAREVPSGSAMERLDFTKTMTLLALPEGEREAVAEKAEAENLSLRKLQEEVDKLTRDLKQEKNNANFYKSAREREKEEADKRVKTMTEAALDAERVKLQVMALEEEKRELEEELSAAKANPPQAAAQGISPEAQAMLDAHATVIADLRMKIQKAEDYAEQQASLRQQAQDDLLKAKRQGTRSDAANTGELTGEGLSDAVRIFLGSAGVLPHMGAALSHLDSRSRAAFQNNVNMIAAWVVGAKRALDMVAGEVTVSGEV